MRRSTNFNINIIGIDLVLWASYVVYFYSDFLNNLLSVNRYIVSVHTGDHWGAETLANVYITLYGVRGDSGARKLHKSSIPGDKFTRNKVNQG